MHSETCPKYGELLRFNPNVKLGDRATNYANCHAYCDKCRIGISNSRNPEKRTYIYKQGCSVLKKWWGITSQFWTGLTGFPGFLAGFILFIL